MLHTHLTLLTAASVFCNMWLFYTHLSAAAASHKLQAFLITHSKALSLSLSASVSQPVCYSLLNNTLFLNSTPTLHVCNNIVSLILEKL